MLAAVLTLALASEDLATLTQRTYAEFGKAAERIPFEGETLDRLTILGRLASEPDRERRKRLFDATADGVRTVKALRKVRERIWRVIESGSTL